MITTKNFGIGPQPTSVLAFLEARDGLECSWNGERYAARVQVAPWYNCRETGIVVYLHHIKSGRQINIAVFEHRVGDHICAAKWEGEITVNPPVLDDLPEETYNEGSWTKTWANGEVSEAADWVYEELEKFWESCEKRKFA